MIRLTKHSECFPVEEAEEAIDRGYTLDLDDIDEIGVFLNKRKKSSTYILAPDGRHILVFDPGCTTLIFVIRLTDDQRDAAQFLVMDEERLKRMAFELRREGWTVLEPA